MRMTKALLFSVLHAHHADARPGLAQQLPLEFDTDDYPDLLERLDLSPAMFDDPQATEALRLAALDADPHGRVLRADWNVEAMRSERDRLSGELDTDAPIRASSAGPAGRPVDSSKAFDCRQRR